MYAPCLLFFVVTPPRHNPPIGHARVNRTAKLARCVRGNYDLDAEDAVEQEREPTIGLPAYHQRREESIHDRTLARTSRADRLEP